MTTRLLLLCCVLVSSEAWISSSLSQRASSSRLQLANDEDLDPLHHNATIDKKVRVAKAQAEIDRILQSPDAPFDMELELPRIQSIAPPVPDTHALEDEHLASLEEDLHEAVRQRDLSRASAIQQEISQQHVDDCGAVLQVNAAYYRAFNQQDLPSMELLWLKDGTSTCIHPSHAPIVGTSAVLDSWKRLFEARDGTKSWIEPCNIRLSVKGASTAIITCDEHVYGRRFVRGQKRQTELVNKLTATNIFRKVGDRWYLVHHHASWHADSEAAKQALKAAKTSVAQSGDWGSRVRPRARKEEGVKVGMDGILGTSNFGPIVGSSEPNEKKPVKRIVMGSLSDIFNGNLGDILSSDENESNGIIHFSSDDDDDEDGEEDGDEGDDEETNVTIIKHYNQSPKSTSSADKKNAPTDEHRQACISALRGLCDQGAISPKQKRVLLTDIISCSAKGEYSMVEVAYELLWGEGEDKDAAEEEFADQCRVLAESLPELPVHRH